MNEDTTEIDPLDLSEEELNKLGLSEHPFVEHAEDSYLYSDSQLEMTSNIIMEYLSNPATTVVLSGENGLGKTTFLRKVLRLGYQQYQFCTLRARSDTDFDEIEDKIKQRWVLAETNEHSSVADLSIENYVITYLREHTHAVLIIDDAHHLDSATLDRLFTLKHRIGLACPLSLGFIVAGENTLKISIAELEDTNPACTQVYQIDVRPFTREQTGNYIEHRLKTAGLENETLLDEASITEIYKATSGNAGLIHEVAIKALQNQCNEDTLEGVLDPHITIKQPKPRVPILLIALIAIIGLGLFFNNRFSKTADVEVENTPVVKSLNSGPTLSPIAQESHTDVQTPSLPLPKIPSSISNNVVVAPVLETGDKKPPSNNGSLLTESVEHLDKEQLKTVEKYATEILENNSPEIVAAKTSAPTSTPPTNSNSSNDSATTKPAADLSHGEDWLKKLDASSYTLQVVATKDVKQLESLVKKEGLKDNYAYFDKPVKDATFYVLVIGNYENRDAAIAATEKLPDNLRKNKPWPVSLKSVQQHLK